MKKTKAITKGVTPKTAGRELAKELKKIENVEHLGTAMYHTSQQFYLLLQDILRQKYNFTEKELKELNKEMTRAVEGLAYFEEKGLNPMSVDSVSKLVDVTLHHYNEFKAAKAGLTLPVSIKGQKLLS